MEEHIKHVDDVLRRLDENGFCITRSKIELGKSEVTWLGYTISAKGVRPDPEKVKRILAMQKPDSISSLRSALGMWTYFSSFIPSYSIIAAPLFAQLKKDNPALQWTKECDLAWEQIKEKLASAPIMGFPDFDDTLYLHTDACKNGFAAILTQDRNGTHVLLDAISRTTSPAEKNYSSAKLECACVIWAAKKWKQYFYAAPLTVIVTDSYGLQFLQQKEDPSPLVQRWILEMEGFNYVVHYHKGAENIADFLSRQKELVACYFTRSKEQLFRPDYSRLNQGERTLVPIARNEQRNDENHDRSGPEPGSQPEAQARAQGEGEPSVGDAAPIGEAPREARAAEAADQANQEPRGDEAQQQQQDDSQPQQREKSQPVERDEPQEHQPQMKPAPSGSAAAAPQHQSPTKPLTRDEFIKAQQEDHRIQRLWQIANGKDVYQPTFREIQDAEGISMVNGLVVKTFISKDRAITRIVVPLALQRRVIDEAHSQSHPGRQGTKDAVRLYHWFRGMKAAVDDVVAHCPTCLAIKGRPRTRERLAPDERPITLGGRWHMDGLALEEVKHEYDHIIVAIDVATKYVVLRASKGETSKASTKVLTDIIRRFGRPIEITTDEGRAFFSEPFEEACHYLGIIYKPIAKGRAQANGMVERVNRTIAQVATALCNGNPQIWPDVIWEIEYAMNTRVSSVTGFTPFELVTGRLPPGPAYTVPLHGDEPWPGRENLTTRCLRQRIEVMEQLAHENQMLAAKRQQSYHDAHAAAHIFEVGDRVLYYKQSGIVRGVTTKLLERWSGPYIITKVIGPRTYTIANIKGEPVPGTVDAENLTKYPSPHIGEVQADKPEGRQV